MKEIFKAIDDAYFLLDKCINKLLKGRITKDEKLEQKAYCDMKYAINDTMQNLSYLEGRLKGKTLNEWIKVTDRLPEYGEDVLVAGYFNGVGDMETWFSHRTKNEVLLKDQNDFCIYDRGCRITHWMPIVLPKED